MSSDDTATSSYELGRRYVHAKTRQPLTLRYIGPLPPTAYPSSSKAPRWLGVEYDDASHGKGHSGTYEGTQVFETAQAGAGAFIRVRGDGRELDGGKTLIEAVKERYDLASEGVGVGAGQEVILGDSGIVVQAPGLENVHRRLKRLERIREIGLEDQFIRGVGGVDEAERQLYRERLRGVVRLDMSRNLLCTWADVDGILDILPGLKTLIINGSRLAHPTEVADLQHLFQLKELHLARSLIKWETVCRLTPVLGNLEELHLDANPGIILDLSSCPLTGLDQLRTLSFAECSIASWSIVENALRSLTSLESLNVSANPLCLGDTSDANALAPVLTGLTTLILLYSSITSLDSLAILSTRLPGLRVLKHSMDPAVLPSPSDSLGLSGNAHDDRARLVAVFPHLVLLNGTEVKPKERDEAERRLLATLPRDHRLYARLAERHASGPSAARSLPPAPPKNSLKSKLITLHVYAPGHEAYSMTILPSAHAAMLRRKIARKLALDPNTILLHTVRRRVIGSDASQVAETDEVWTRDKVALVEDGEVGYWFDDGDGVIVEI